MSTTGQRPDVVIVGGGVIGWACAYYLSKSDLRVLVLDAGARRPTASRAAAGLIAPSPQLTKPSPFASLAMESARLFPALRDELLATSGVDIRLDRCGTLRVATTEQQAASQQRRLPQQCKLGLELEWLSGTEARSIEPALPDHVLGAVYGPLEAQLDALQLIRAFRVGAERCGAVGERAVVQRLVTNRSHIVGVQTARGTMKAAQVVLASGAWSSQFAEQLGVEIPMTPERGQVILARRVSPRLRHILFMDQLYFAPKARATTVIGAAKDQVGFHGSTSLGGVSELLVKALQSMPALATASFGEARAGIRPRTPDGVPLIGPMPGWSGIHLATGHGSNGLLFSPRTGQLITASIVGQDHQLEAYSIRPDRPKRFAPANRGGIPT